MAAEPPVWSASAFRQTPVTHPPVLAYSAPIAASLSDSSCWPRISAASSGSSANSSGPISASSPES